MDTIFNMDCITGMQILQDNTVDLTVMSPVYNLGVKYNAYSDKLSIEEYRAHIQKMLIELYRVTKVGGRVCINVPIITKDWGENERRVSADQLFQNCLDNAGFIFREKIIWNKRGVRKRMAWGSYKSPSCPWVTYPVDVILVYVKVNQKKTGRKELATISSEEFKTCTYGLWWVTKKVLKASKKRTSAKDVQKHPAKFPMEIPKRLINFYSYQGDTVLDPYMGIGTTCVVAKKLKRHYIGFEISKEYFEEAKEYLNRVKDE